MIPTKNYIWIDGGENDLEGSMLRKKFIPACCSTLLARWKGGAPDLKSSTAPDLKSCTQSNPCLGDLEESSDSSTTSFLKTIMEASSDDDTLEKDWVAYDCMIVTCGTDRRRRFFDRISLSFSIFTLRFSRFVMKKTPKFRRLRRASRVFSGGIYRISDLTFAGSFCCRTGH